MVAYLSDPPEYARDQARRDLRPSAAAALYGVTNTSRVYGVMAAGAAFLAGTFLGLTSIWVLLMTVVGAYVVGHFLAVLVGRRRHKPVVVDVAHEGSHLAQLLDACMDPSVESIAEVLAHSTIRGDGIPGEALATDLFRAWRTSGSLSDHTMRQETRRALLHIANDLPDTAEADALVSTEIRQVIDGIETVVEAEAQVQAVVDAPLTEAALEQKSYDQDLAAARARALSNPLRDVLGRIEAEAALSRAVANDLQDHDAKE